MLSLVLILYFASVIFIVGLFLAPIVMRRLWTLIDLRHERLRGKVEPQPVPVALETRRNRERASHYRGQSAPKLYVV